MKTGNKSQAVLLSVIAVGAIAFLAHQVMPAKLVSLGLVSTAPTVASTPPSDQVKLPLTLVGNPFSHPKLATKPAVVATTPTVDIDKNLPFDPFSGPLGRPSNDAGASGSNTADSAGKDRQKPQEPQIRLAAVIAVGAAEAMLEVNGKDAQAFSVGDLVTANTRLVSVRDAIVAVRINGVVHEIAMGETYGSKENKQ
jgi:hypothetical protein